MASKVAIIKFDGDPAEQLKQVLNMIGGIDDINTAERSVVIKVGVFSHKAGNHTSVSLVKAISNCFDRAPKIFLAESDNYRGTGTERLQIWKELFTERIVPFNLSGDSSTRRVKLAGEEMNLSHILFKPNVLVDTHILRVFERGSILKNLFGCIPTPKKAKYHKVLPKLLADVYEAIDGVDLSVMDGTYLWHGASDVKVPMNMLLVSRDAVAVETVGAILAGLKPEKNPVIQEFLKRDLGVGDIEDIEIIGTSLESLREESKSANVKLRKKWKEHGGAPSIWAPTIDRLIKNGFFQLPNKRTRDDVVKAFEARGISTKGYTGVIGTTLTRRVRKGKLKAVKELNGWVYWTE